MVSFQCDSCSDVVKKPKLDQHHSRGCRASFTCIDCSHTFQTPVDWKGHTSCISEEQKYQKTLYKPKPNGGRDFQRPGQAGRFQGQGGPWTRPTRYQATGANGTPLGTPTRMSPVTTQPSTEEAKSSTAVPASVEVAKSTEAKPPKPHKKRKAENAESAVVEAPQPDVNGQEDSGSKDKKKDKKDKKEKKDKKRAKVEEAAATEPNGALTEDTSLAQPTVVADSDEKPKKSKKSKKDKKPKETATAESLDGQELPGQASTEDQTDIGREKKKKKKKTESVDESGVNGAMDSIPPKEKKEKKRKREAEEVSGTVEDAGEGKKKKKKKAAS